MEWREETSAADERRARFGRPGGDWQGLRPSFDNPLTWAVSLGRVSGIHVRVHAVFLLFILISLARSISSASKTDPTPDLFRLTALSMAASFIFVMAHEFGHCLACRAVRGVADEILMWPLGGLAFCRPPHNWSAHVVTAIGGPAVNLVLCAVMTPILGISSGQWWGIAIPNPFDLSGAFDLMLRGDWPLMALYVFNLASWTLLAFNLLPMFPLDGGRLAQALLWPRCGYSLSMRYVLRVGYLMAVGLAVLGFVTDNPWMICVALAGAVTSYLTHKQLAWSDAEELVPEEQELPAPTVTLPDVDPEVEAKRRRADREEAEAREVDRILQKIAATGLGSLNDDERAALRRDTERKRQRQAPGNG